MNTKLVSLAAIAAMTLAPLAAQAQKTIAQDNAGNTIYASGFSGLNGGTGFGAFSVVVEEDFELFPCCCF